MDIRIDPELQGLLPPLSDTEFDELTDAMLILPTKAHT